MLEFLSSNRAPRKPFINLTTGTRVSPFLVKDEVYGVIADVIKKLE